VNACSNMIKGGQNHTCIRIHRIGQNRMFAPYMTICTYMTVCMVISLLKILHVYRVYL